MYVKRWCVHASSVCQHHSKLKYLLLDLPSKLDEKEWPVEYPEIRDSWLVLLTWLLFLLLQAGSLKLRACPGVNDTLSGSLPAASWLSDAHSGLLLRTDFLASAPAVELIVGSCSQWSEGGALFSAVSVVVIWLWGGTYGLWEKNSHDVDENVFVETTHYVSSVCQLKVNKNNEKQIFSYMYSTCTCVCTYTLKSGSPDVSCMLTST